MRWGLHKPFIPVHSSSSSGVIMGPHRRPGAHRWQCVAAVGLLLLQLSLAQTIPPQASCSADQVQHNITQPVYPDTSGKDTLATFMSAPVQSFLHTVQPRPFPKDLIQEIYKDYQRVTTDQTLIKKILRYEVGFLVCVAIGVVYIVLMPVVGFFLACCRCCGNCGGKMYQKQTSSVPCRRKTLYWSAFITTVIILAGNVCMFRSNQVLNESVENGFQDLNQTLDNVHTFIHSVPEQMSGVLNGSSDVMDAVSKNIDHVGHQLGLAIQTRLSGSLDPSLESVGRLDQETGNVDRQVNVLSSTLDQLQSNMDVHRADLGVVKTDLGTILSRPNCVGCSGVNDELQAIELPTSINNSSMSQFQAALDEVVQINLTARVKEVNDMLDKIPQTVTDETKEVAQTIKQQLEQFSELTGRVDLSVMSNLADMLAQAKSQIETVKPQVERGEEIRWAVCLAVCCVVLLVIVCNILGLLLGPTGLKHGEDPTQRSSTADCGGTFLLMGAGISFFFSWLFMIVVLLLFVLGGNVYTLLCQPWRSGELLKFIDSLDVVSQLGYGNNSGLPMDFNISDVYSECQQNQPLWSALHLEKFVALEQLLDISRYTDEIQQQFDNINITLSTVTLLPPEVKQKLGSFSAESDNLDFSSVSQQLNSVSQINLNSTADQLEALAVPQPNSETKTDIQTQADKLRQLQSNIEINTFPLLQQVNSTIKSLKITTGSLKVAVDGVLTSVDAAQTFLNTNTSLIVKTESRDFVNCQLRYLEAFVDWARLAITEQIGRCEPVSKSVDAVEIIVCSYMTESLNAFWFSLGWCIVFFIPSIILSIKLAKYYRKMKYSDVYENAMKLDRLHR